MRFAVRLLRSLVFDLWFYGSMAVIGLAVTPFALFSRDAAYFAIKSHCRLSIFMLWRICRIRTEWRGPIPQGEVVVAAKHQSFLDIIMIAHVLERPKFVMKKELVWAPILGWYALRIGATPVDRGKGRSALEGMAKGLEGERSEGGQIVIYPQGTRVAPGVAAPYKIGAAVVAQRFRLPCVLAATNAGLVWGRKTWMRRPGVAVVEFLEPPLEPFPEPARTLAEMERRIEAASSRLLEEGRAALG